MTPCVVSVQVRWVTTSMISALTMLRLQFPFTPLTSTPWPQPRRHASYQCISPLPAPKNEQKRQTKSAKPLPDTAEASRRTGMPDNTYNPKWCCASKRCAGWMGHKRLYTAYRCRVQMHHACGHTTVTRQTNNNGPPCKQAGVYPVTAVAAAAKPAPNGCRSAAQGPSTTGQETATDCALGASKTAGLRVPPVWLVKHSHT